MSAMKKLLFLLLALFILSACTAEEDKVSNFTFTDQNGESFGLADLKGEVWLADFIFTNCDTVCPPMTANMARVQDRLKEQGINAKLVSFSVDPEVDTPEMLKEFAQKFNADFDYWTFLTGYTQEEIEKFGMENFKTLINKPDNADQVTHMTSFYLVDQKGRVVKTYSGFENTPYDEIIADIKDLQ